MGDQAMVARSDRSGLTVLRGAISNQAAGDHFETFSLPSGFGDCRLYAVMVQITGITTETFTSPPDGVKFSIYDLTGAVNTDFIESGEWVAQQAGAAAVAVVCTAQLIVPVLWRDAERLAVTYTSPESTATGDLEVYARVQRLRNL